MINTEHSKTSVSYEEQVVKKLAEMSVKNDASSIGCSVWCLWAAI